MSYLMTDRSVVEDWSTRRAAALKPKLVDSITVTRINDKIVNYQGMIDRVKGYSSDILRRFLGELLSAMEGAETAKLWRRNDLICKQLASRVTGVTKEQTNRILDLEKKHRKILAKITSMEKSRAVTIPKLVSQHILAMNKASTSNLAPENVTDIEPVKDRAATTTQAESIEEEDFKYAIDSDVVKMISEAVAPMPSYWRMKLEAELIFLYKFLDILTPKQRDELIKGITIEDPNSPPKLNDLILKWTSGKKNALTPAEVSAITAAFSQGWLADLFTTAARPHGTTLSLTMIPA